MRNGIVKIVVMVAVVMEFAAGAAAQVTVGENTNLNLSGDLSAGYSGVFGDTVSSTHGLMIGGNGRLNGSYYNPKFLSFDIHPYYNRSQNNSASQSITNSSGIDSTADLFSGSRFPGSVSYGRSFEGTGEFGMPGSTGFTTHGDGSNFGISWSALVPKLPPVTASFTQNTSNVDIFGASATSSNRTRNFNLQSSYALDGFRFTGGYHRQTTSADFPELFTGEAAHSADNTTNQFDLQTSHNLPLKGQWFLGWTHSRFGGDYANNDTQRGSNSGAIHVINTGAVVNPTDRLSLSLVTTYNTNVFGALQQQILQAGGDVSQDVTRISSKSLTLNGTAYYRLTDHIGLNGNVVRLNQYFAEGTDLGVTQYGGGVNVNYAFRALGTLSFSVGAVDTASQEGNTGAAVVTNVNYSRRFGRWETGANFSYSQQVQTLLATYTTSMYNFSGDLRRRFANGLQWTFVGHGSHSGFTREAGSSNHAEGASSTLTWGHFAANATASRSGGVSILTTQGLVTLPNVPPELIREQVLFNAHSYGGGASVSIKRAVVTFNYVKANSLTRSTNNPSNFDTTLMNARLVWRLRKLYLNGGYTRLDQGFLTTTGNRPNQVNTFYFGVSRWFNVF